MSLLKANAVQLGQSLTASQNFTWYQPATPDGTVRLGNGNSGSVTDLVTLTSAGNLGIGTSSPSTKLQVGGTAAGSGASGALGVFLSRGVTTNFYEAYDGTKSFIAGVDNSQTFAKVGTLSSHPVALVSGNGVGSLLLDTSGNLGLGVTPSAWRTDVSFKALQLPGGSFTAYMAGGVDQTPGIAANGYVDSGGTWRYINSRAASWYIQNGGMHAWYNAPSGTAGNTISFTQAMTLDASGNLLVGSTSTTYSEKLSVLTSSSAKAAFIKSRHDTSGDTVLLMWNGLNTNNTSSYQINCICEAVGGTGQVFVVYGNGNVQNQNNSYGSLSDASIKENITDATPKLEDLLNVRIRNFNLINDPEKTKQIGVVAQELEAIFPSMIDENENGIKSVKYSVFVPMLIKAIQELSAELNELKKKVNA